MPKIYYVLVGLCISILVIYLLVATFKYVKLREEINVIKSEQDKINFRLFVYEKIQRRKSS